MSDDSKWHLSKSVPISIIIGMVAQAILVVVFFANLRSDVDNNIEDILENRVRITATEIATQRQDVLLGRIDENLKAIREAIEDLKDG